MTRPAAAFLDRDGTINVKAPEGEYVESPDELVLLPGAAAAVRALNDAGVPVAVVTNQRGVALGRMTLDDLQRVHDRLDALLADAAGARVDRYYACPHDKDSCDCRKPRPGMLLQAARDLGIDPRDAVMIGDSESDAEAGRRAGARAIRLGADVPTLGDAVALVLSGRAPPGGGTSRT